MFLKLSSTTAIKTKSTPNSSNNLILSSMEVRYSFSLFIGLSKVKTPTFPPQFC